MGAEAKRLQSGLGKDDREKMDEYATSVRELEKRLAKDEEWFRKPKPKVDENGFATWVVELEPRAQSQITFAYDVSTAPGVQGM